MIEVVGNLWEFDADAKIITTNGYVRKDGAAVMGRGVARQCMRKFHGIEFILGELIKQGGNIPYLFGKPPAVPYKLYSFPVKYNFWEKADLTLIRASAMYLRAAIPADEKVVMPRPGCGNGQLDWKDVKPVIEPILDDRFYVIELP